MEDAPFFVPTICLIPAYYLPITCLILMGTWSVTGKMVHNNNTLRLGDRNFDFTVIFTSKTTLGWREVASCWVYCLRFTLSNYAFFTKVVFMLWACAGPDASIGP